uniref:Uncharacterized protein n=1 Tax=Oryza barthii TaxID=65489 RepID=A0A0D3HIY2_9ORYZ
MESGNAVKQSIAEEVPGSRLHVMEMDLASLDSVRCFATAFDSSHTHLNILINNAGIMGCPFKLSKDGIELQFATNHMKSTARKTGVQGRIVNVSSIAHKRSDGSCFDLNKLNDKSRYKPLIAYAHSKLANILHANELAKRFQEEGCNLTANSLHPGVILTNITRYVVTNSVMVSILSVGNLFLKNTQQGAATTCYLALHPELKDVSGKYFADCKEATPRPAARDAELAKRLWDFSEQLVDTNRREQGGGGMGFSWGWLCGRRNGPSGFGGASTADEVTAGVDASRLTVVVTGATNGIGKETARVLALRGAEVILPARTLESGMKVKQSLAEEIPSSKLHVMEMDLSSLDSVRSFAKSFNSSYRHLNVLINNAGVMSCPFGLSKDGIELQFATNHVGHFLLTNLLLDKMKATAKETGLQGRIINVSSISHRGSDGSCFDLDKLNDKSKLEEGCNLTANSLHPGVIATNLPRHILTNSLIISIFSVMKPFLKSIPQGAATNCYLALHPGLKDVSGKYFADCNEATPTAVARDAELAKKLWEFSEELTSGDQKLKEK